MCNLFAKQKGLIVILFLMAGPGCTRENGTQQRSSGEGAPQMFADAKMAASQSLQTFRKLITRENYKILGFDSLEEATGAQLGAPLPIFFVRLDRLREYQPGGDPNTLLSDSAQVYYPVLVKEQVRSAIVVEMVDGKWKAASFGNAGLAKQVARVQKEGTSPSGAASEPDMIVQVPALGIYFVGRRGPDKRLILISLATDPRYALKDGAEQPADVVFARLVPFAKSHNGLPT